VSAEPDAMPHEELLRFLERRRSVPLTQFTGPGPDDAELRRLLAITARVPDHGRLEPWRFIIYRPQTGRAIGAKLAELAQTINGPLREDELDKERNRLARAPVAVGIVSATKEHERIPDWEQFLSAGAAAMNLVTAATAHGFAANWVTGWFCDHPEGRAILGLSPHERVAGIVHLGHVAVPIPGRPRPDVGALSSAAGHG